MTITHTHNTLIATSIGIGLASSFAAIGLALTYWVMPALVLPAPTTTSAKPETSSPLIARQWRSIYVQGQKWGPRTGLTTAIAWLYAANTVSDHVYARNCYIASAVLALSAVPYTFIVMARTNNELWRRAGAADSGDDLGVKKLTLDGARSVEEYPTEDLVAWWSTLNMGRGMLPLAGVVCAVYATLQ